MNIKINYKELYYNYRRKELLHIIKSLKKKLGFMVFFNLKYNEARYRLDELDKFYYC